MKARLVKKDDIKPAAPRRRKRVARTARRGGPGVDPRAAFEALFERLADRDQEIAGFNGDLRRCEPAQTGIEAELQLSGAGA